MLGRSYRLVQVVSSGVLAGDEGGDMVLAGAAVCGRGEVRGRWWWGNEWADAPSLSKPAPPPASASPLSSSSSPVPPSNLVWPRCSS